MLAAARAAKLDYYQDLLVRELERGLR
jgi:hypothetical protein